MDKKRKVTKMKIQYASDLHLEFGMNSRYMSVYGLKPVGNILLLAGDVIYLENRRMEQNQFFDWCSRNYEETIIVPGNHEYYRDPIARLGHQDGISVEKTLVDYEHKIRDNVRYLNNRSVCFGEMEVFATTLWSIVAPGNYVDVQLGMNDCRQILYGGHCFCVGDYAKIHGICRDWLDKALGESKAKTKIVLTHHCPTLRREFDVKHFGGALETAFRVNMEDFIGKHDIDFWIYGHTHTQDGSGTVLPSAAGGTKLVCNQLGYVALDEDLEGFKDYAFLEI